MTDFSSLSFIENNEQIKRLIPVVLQSIDTKQAPRILDIGCGTAGLLRVIATHRPDAEFVGIDISHANVEVANALNKKLAVEKTVFITSNDYRTTPLGKFDLIVSSSTLHLIDLKFDALFEKISSELSAEGELIVTVPLSTWDNYFLVVMRNVFKIFDCNMLRRLIFFVARSVYTDTSAEVIQDRVAYMFIIPNFMFSSKLIKKLLDKFSLSLFSQINEPIVFGKPRHAIFSFKKLTR